MAGGRSGRSCKIAGQKHWHLIKQQLQLVALAFLLNGSIGFFSLFGPGIAGQIPVRKDASKTLLVSNIVGLDQRAVAKELLSEEWTEDTLLIKLLMQQGAQAVKVQPRVGHTRGLDFKMHIGIPWGKVNMRANIAGISSPAEMDSNFVDVNGKIRTVVRSDHGIVVNAIYSCHGRYLQGLTINMRFVIRPNGCGSGARDCSKLLFSGGVSFPSWVQQDGLIARFMELGFMRAEKMYGQALHSELQRWTSRQAP
mmetsp:Transcript_64907/g.141452  ORF Transcript_64907/g.141452 Transcript_64907/m.141452 type:complete len:253 (-) Transcript_64907:194-952(-)